MYTIEACTVFKNKFTWFQYSKNNRDNRLAWSVKSFTWLDGFDVSASRVPTGLKAEVRAAVGRLIQTDSHVTVIHLMERQWTEEMLPEAGDHVIASCRETPDLWCSDAYGAFTRILTVCIKFPHTHTPHGNHACLYVSVKRLFTSKQKIAVRSKQKPVHFLKWVKFRK